MRRRHGGMAVFAAMLGAAAIAAPALAGGAGAPKVRTAKSAGGPYGKVTSLHVPNGESRTGYVKVISTVGEAQDATLTTGCILIAKRGECPIVTRWFKGKKNISGDVHTTGYEFTLRPDRPKRFKVRFKATSDATRCIVARVDAPPDLDGFGYFAVNGQHACDA